MKAFIKKKENVARILTNMQTEWNNIHLNMLLGKEHICEDFKISLQLDS